ncbi:MAG: aspartate-semialdehyde dehydrogenase [Chloroflexi bacterium HGW-Chloroflexi-1]|nr:MAG: aspartate-semialdehyde dehydrogenase [Chloroflexi bacterium HGW-Chloroflexi-1]
MSADSKLKVGILGATGAVGQRFVQLLAEHPWFEVVALTASDRSVGKRYGDACNWLLRGGMPPAVAEMTVVATEPAAINSDVHLLFSAMPGDLAGPLEEAFAAAGFAVCSNTSAHRQDPDVPLLIPDVNPDHTALIPFQQARRGWARLEGGRRAGFIVTNPNCSTTHLVCALKPLHDAFGLVAVNVVTMQALSGAGYPGVASLDILDNVIPYIGGEEEKIESEPLKLLGTLTGDAIALAGFVVSAQANRVAVRNGHLEAVSVKLKAPAALSDVAEAFTSYRGEPQRLGLPTAPDPAIIFHTAPDRPQPRMDRLAGGGMATHVGRLRPDPLFDYKFIVLGHNTVRGAAGGAILNAELLVAQGYLGNVTSNE